MKRNTWIKGMFDFYCQEVSLFSWNTQVKLPLPRVERSLPLARTTLPLARTLSYWASNCPVSTARNVSFLLKYTWKSNVHPKMSKLYFSRQLKGLNLKSWASQWWVSVNCKKCIFPVGTHMKVKLHTNFNTLGGLKRKTSLLLTRTNLKIWAPWCCQLQQVCALEFSCWNTQAKLSAKIVHSKIVGNFLKTQKGKQSRSEDQASVKQNLWLHLNLLPLPVQDRRESCWQPLEIGRWISACFPFPWTWDSRHFLASLVFRCRPSPK